MNNLAIIPARGGSKRIYKKNIKLFFDKPIISYSIDLALKSKMFEKVIVSTDDIEIANISKEHGAEVPFFRSAENSDDYASTYSVIYEVLEKLKNSDKFYDNVCCIYPCSPLISVENIKKAYNMLIDEKYSSVFPVVKYSTPIQRALKFENNKIKFINSENALKRSQDFEDVFYDAGQFYWLNVEKVLSSGKLISKNSNAIVLKETDVQDIDNIEDFKITEIKYKIKNKL